MIHTELSYFQVLRPGWSPDGSIIVSAHAMNGGGPTAQIVERGTWKANRDFVGHKKAVSCARFCGKGERLCF